MPNVTVHVARCGTLKNPYFSMAMSAGYRSKFSALHRQWWRLHMSAKLSSGTKTLNPPPQKKLRNLACWRSGFDPQWIYKLSFKKQVVNALLRNARQQVWVSSEMTCVTVGLACQRTITAQWPKVSIIRQNWSPSSVMVTSPYEWKILEWNVNLQTNMYDVCWLDF